jgi:hypothetical protein
MSLGLVQVPYSIFKEWEASKQGNSTVYTEGCVKVSHSYPIYCEGWIMRRWAKCKVILVEPGMGGYHYTFTLSGFRFADNINSNSQPNPWYYNWFGIF